MDFKNISNEELWLLLADSQIELKRRGLIRTRNITGERGEFIAIETYSGTPGLPNLQAAPEGTQNVDALSRKGERYSIKTVTVPSRTTGVFYGITDSKDGQVQDKKFEHLIIVELFQSLRPKRILELSWQNFLKHKRWHSTMNAWNISVTKSVLSDAKIIFETDKDTTTD